MDFVSVFFFGIYIYRFSFLAVNLNLIIYTLSSSHSQEKIICKKIALKFIELSFPLNYKNFSHFQFRIISFLIIKKKNDSFR